MKRKVVLFGLAIALLLGVGWVLRPSFLAWQQRRAVAAADAFLAQGDLRSAALAARQILRFAPRHQRALEILAQTARAARSPEAILWQQRLVELDPNNPDLALDLVRTALAFDETYIAHETLARLPPTARDTAGYHTVAAALAVAAGQRSEAERHLEQAVARDPADPTHEMNLCVVRLQSSDPQKKALARATLERLSTTPALRVDVLRALLADAQAAKDNARALELAHRLEAAPEASIRDRLAVLDELWRQNSAEFPAALRAWQDAVRTPAEAGALMEWMNVHGQAAGALEWSATLPKNIAAQMPVPLFIGKSLLLQRNWHVLRAHLLQSEWGALDFLRDAFAAKALYESGGGQKDAAFRLRWERAIMKTVGNPAALAMLASTARGWNWPEEAAQVWWLLANHPTGNRRALKALYRFYDQSKNTRELYRVAQRILKVEPDNPVAKNNVAMLALLLEVDLARAHALAAEIAAAYPDQPALVSTYAFSLFKQQRAHEAAALLDRLPATAFDEPTMAACRGVVLEAAGRHEEARPFLQRAVEQREALFPEERALVGAALNGP